MTVIIAGGRELNVGTTSFLYHVNELVEEPTEILIKKYKGRARLLLDVVLPELKYSINFYLAKILLMSLLYLQES